MVPAKSHVGTLSFASEVRGNHFTRPVLVFLLCCVNLACSDRRGTVRAKHTLDGSDHKVDHSHLALYVLLDKMRSITSLIIGTVFWTVCQVDADVLYPRRNRAHPIEVSAARPAKRRVKSQPLTEVSLSCV